MKPINPVIIAVCFSVICFNCSADELAISLLTPLEMPPLTTDGWIDHRHPGVAVSGTNAVIYWSQMGWDDPGTPSLSPPGVMNLMFSRLDAQGLPIDSPPELAVSMPFQQRYQARMVPASSGFFAVFVDSVNFDSFTGISNVFFTHISAQGSAMFEPVRLSTNQKGYEYQVASTGLTLLYAESDRTNGIRFKLLDQNGGTISSGALPQSDFAYPHTPPAFTVVNDGNNYLLVWESPTAGYYLRFISIAGDTGANTTFYSPYPGGLGAVAPGKNGYLVLLGGGRALWLRQNLDRIVQADVQVPSSGSGTAIYPEGEGWVVFTPGQTSYNSYRITPSFLNGQPHLTSEPHPYPSFTPTADAPENRIVPFGPGRYLVARVDGVSVLTAAGITAAVKPKSFQSQGGSAFAASPFGYFAAWIERGATNNLLRGLRLARDGSRIDAHSFVIAEMSRSVSGPSCIFDGNDYLVTWGDVYPNPPHLARISPQGAPDIRLQTVPVFGVNYVSLLAQQNQLFGYWYDPNIDRVHIWKISATGQLGPEILVHGQTLISDGKNLVSIGLNDQLQVCLITVDPAAANPEISTNVVAVGTSASGSSLQHGFVLFWMDQSGAPHYAYYSDGQEKLRINANVASIADTTDRLLVVSRTTSFPNHRYTFQTYNLQTGETASQEADLGTMYHGPLIGSAGKDFLAIGDSLGRKMEYIGRVWVTVDGAPALASPQITSDGVKATLNLTPERRYRIETSEDLENWILFEVTGGVSLHDVTIGGSEKEFVRAILVPE